MRRLAIAATTLVAFALPAQARAHHHHHRHVAYHHHYRHYVHHRHHDDGVTRHYVDGRPAAWCGWFMRQIEHVADASFNLARNWSHWGRATEAHVGAVVVWPHHVGKIVGGTPGHWAVLSGNDGHRVRTRVRSLAGAIAFRE